MNSSASYVTHILAPILPKFLARYPEIAIDIVQTDALADMVADRTDIAIRAGPLAESSLVARSLGFTHLIVAAAPSWIARHGMPETPEELAAHDRLGFAYSRASGGWLRRSGDAPDRIRVSDGEGIRQLVLAGVAPARLAGFTIRDDLAAGRLVPLLPTHLEPLTEEFHAVYVGRPDMVPRRVRVLVDHLASCGTVA